MNPRRFKPFTPKKRVKHNTPDILSWSRLPIYILPDVLLNDVMTEILAEKHLRNHFFKMAKVLQAFILIIAGA